ncbi:wtf meiotic driver [Schizosaccharomyces osmophilus]|uniref:Wtf meiotic driver n=1 Tax=Schizosaccharomyces osmophilus TaxID=2545709 RepID=A0AAE9W9U1_9SCHI|nr:wtf meiotic driver [Schizosaccharomyces osmophilus]WBW71965.1 wtf meiotic driver [Schizosaccharomyces osmophilus]
MKNKYTPISDSDDSSKTLNDEKADSRSSPSDGTPPPYTASTKFIDLEMADGSAQNSAQESVNNSGSGWTNTWQIIMHLLLFTSFAYMIFYAIFLVVFFYFKLSLNALDLWGLSAGCVASFALFLFAIFQMPKEWFTQAGRSTKKVLKKSGRATKNVLSALCISALYVCFLDVLGFTVYYAAKKLTGFEKINNNIFYFVCFVNVVLFFLLTMNANARELLRLVIIDLKNGIGSGVNGIGNGIGVGVNGIGNGIGNTVDRILDTNRGEQVPQNEGIELQPLAEQSAEV